MVLHHVLLVPVTPLPVQEPPPQLPVKPDISYYPELQTPALYVQLLVPSLLPETPVLPTDIIWPPPQPLFTLLALPELYYVLPLPESLHHVPLVIISD
jgi:hypothetical protein